MGTATSGSWRSQQSQNSYYSHQANEIASASQVSSYQGNNNQYMSSNPGYESWSPDHSPSRNHPNMRGQQQPSRKHDSSSHPYWNQNKRWR